VNITQRYEMIRSILKREKSPDQVSKEKKRACQVFCVSFHSALIINTYSPFLRSESKAVPISCSSEVYSLSISY
jgi:hypothetical protein